MSWRPYDLPPKWRGRIVKWDPWEIPPHMFICPPLPPSCCPSCGAVDAIEVQAVGTLALSPSTTQADLDAEAENLRKLGGAACKVKRLTLWGQLVATRCPECKADLVWDREEDAMYALDDDDYGPNGAA